MIEAIYLKARRTASSLRVKKKDLGRLIGRAKGEMATSCMPNDHRQDDLSRFGDELVELNKYLDARQGFEP